MKSAFLYRGRGPWRAVGGRFSDKARIGQSPDSLTVAAFGWTPSSELSITSGSPEPIHMSGASAFRPCGRELAEFFKSTGWALHIQVTEAVFSFRAGKQSRRSGANR